MSTQRTYRDRAIILRGRALGDADRILHLYTLEHGKLAVVAKAIRKPKSRLAGRVEIATEIIGEFHRGRKMDVLTDADIVQPYWQHLLEPHTYAAMATVLDVIDSCCELGDPNAEVYQLLCGMLAALGRFPTPEGLVPRFELRLLTLLGVGPDCDACLDCGQSLSDRSSVVAIEQGGFHCEQCTGSIVDPELRLRPEEVALFAALSRAPGDPRRIALRSTPRITQIIAEFLLQYLGRKPRSEAAVTNLLADGVP